MSDVVAIAADLAQLHSEHARLTSELTEVNDRLETKTGDDAGLTQRGENLLRGLANLDAKIAAADAEYRTTVLDGLAAGTFGREAGSEPGSSNAPVSGLKAQAQRVIDAAHKRTEGVDDVAFAKAEALVSFGPPPARALAARWAIATGDPDYETAFCKMVADATRGHLTWTPREAQAYQRVADVQAEQKAMALTPDTAGGFMVPFTLDPSVILTSAGSVNPLRQISRTVTTVTDQWAGVTSQGVVAEWLAELAQAADATPVLVQPNIPVHKGSVFTPFSVELEGDAPTLMNDLRTILGDAVDQLQATAFCVGTGTGQPTGLITALVAAGGATVIATGSNVLAPADLYNNQAALPARWRPNARWMMNLSIINGYRQLPQATGLNYSIVNDDGPTPKALGWEIHENSNMDGTLTAAAADYLVLSGDFAQFVIVDRVGTTMELVPHLFGAAGRPTGQRGAWMWFRAGSNITAADAFRLSNFST